MPLASWLRRQLMRQFTVAAWTGSLAGLLLSVCRSY